MTDDGTTLDLRLRPGVLLLQWLTLLHALPAAALPLAGIDGWPALCAAAAIAASWFHVRRHPALGFGPRAITRLILHADGQWALQIGAAPSDAVTPEPLPAELLAGSVLWRRLIVLRFRLPDGRRRDRVLLGGETADEPLARLRARLRSGVTSPS
jgi:hypothetical protein